MENKLDVIVIGAGQAGLVTGYYLKKAGLNFLLLESMRNIGDSWRQRYDSLRLFTPRKYDSLPGLDFPGSPSGFPTKDEVADYLSYYASHHQIPVRLNVRVEQLRKENNYFVTNIGDKSYLSNQVVIASGPFQHPIVPSFSAEISVQITQLHSSAYRNTLQLQQGPVLVVGAGNSGAHIATELAASHEVHISASSNLHFKPLTILGKSIFWYYEKLGFLTSNLDTIQGRMVSKQPEQIYGYELKQQIAKGTIQIHPRTMGASGTEFFFADGSVMSASNVIWATGYTRDHSWISVDGAKNTDGKIMHTTGSSPVEGLYFVGLLWQTCRGSALLGWVKYDAQRIVSQVLSSHRQHQK